MTADEVKQLRVDASLLTRLLEDPQPGLMSWEAALNLQLGKVASYGTPRQDATAKDTTAKATASVVAAITNEGPAPLVHRQRYEQLRREWPTLWHALKELLRAKGVA